MIVMTAAALARLHTLHGVAWVAVRVVSPARARRAVDAAARFVPSFRSEEDAAQGERALGSMGSCLTRALAVSALLPGSEVVIGADASRSAKLHAHAWVEVNGRPVGDTQGPGVERIGSLGPAARSKGCR
jgi:hypothetical protein